MIHIPKLARRAFEEKIPLRDEMVSSCGDAIGTVSELAGVIGGRNFFGATNPTTLLTSMRLGEGCTYQLEGLAEYVVGSVGDYSSVFINSLWDVPDHPLAAIKAGPFSKINYNFSVPVQVGQFSDTLQEDIKKKIKDLPVLYCEGGCMDVDYSVSYSAYNINTHVRDRATYRLDLRAYDGPVKIYIDGNLIGELPPGKSFCAISRWGVKSTIEDFIRYMKKELYRTAHEEVDDGLHGISA